MTVRGRLFRSELPLLDAPGLQWLTSLGLRTVVDLRDAEEALEEPATLPAGVRSVGVPVAPPCDASGRGLGDQLRAGVLETFGSEELTAVTITMIDSQASSIGRAIAALAADGGLPALIHCFAGKDRTGIVAGIVLGAVGVRRDAIVDDYERSTAGRAHRIPVFEARLAQLGVPLERVFGLFSAPRVVMESTLDHIEHRYGGVRGYLVDAGGRTDDELVRLRANLVANGRA